MNKQQHDEWKADPRTHEVLKALRKHISKHKEHQLSVYWENPEKAGEHDILHHTLQVKAYELVLDELEAGDFCED